jgi:hypothetical protein
MENDKSTNYEVKILNERKSFEIVESKTDKTIFKAELFSDGQMDFVEILDTNGEKIRSFSEISSVDDFEYICNVLKIASTEVSNLMKTFVAGK